MVDAAVSKTAEDNLVRVRIPLPAHFSVAATALSGVGMPVAKRQEWEHKVVVARGIVNGDLEIPNSSLGEEQVGGWELVSAVSRRAGDTEVVWLFFKRLTTRTTKSAASAKAAVSEEDKWRHREELSAERASCLDDRAFGGTHRWLPPDRNRCALCAHTKAWANGEIEDED
jgi:hypothetical protein